jgi:hypothetical protein
MTRNEYLTDAMDLLDSINDAAWAPVCGAQGREEFAALAYDSGQSIEDAWCEAVRHANTLA